MRGEITITDDDSTPTPTVNNPSVAEGNSGLTDLAFDVTLPCPRPAVTFNYRTVADTATASDFTEVGGAPLVFNSCGAGAVDGAEARRSRSRATRWTSSTSRSSSSW